MINFLNSLLIISSLFTFKVMANVPSGEVETFIEAVKEKEDEELILSSEQFKECKEKFKNFKQDSSKKDDLVKCLNEKILAEGSDQEEANTKLLEVAKKLGITSVNPKIGESPKSIKEYLQKRIRRVVHGDAEGQEQLRKLSEKEFVDHRLYYQLYKEQVGKNTLLQVSRYCIENFGYEDPFNLVIVPKSDEKNKENLQNGNITKEMLFKKIDVSEVNSKLKGKSSSEIIKTPYVERFVLNKTIKDDPRLAFDLIKPIENSLEKSVLIWRNQSKIKEFELCTREDEKQCDEEFKKKDYRPLKAVELLKDAEFALNSVSGNNQVLQDKYNFCAGQVVKNMCEIYRCNNVYSLKTPEKERRRCKSLFNITVNKEDSTIVKKDPNNPNNSNFRENFESSDSKGAIACTVQKRLSQYRKVLKALKEIDSDFDAQQINISKFAGGASNFGFRGNFQVGDKVDRLTSISSTELTENVSTLSGAEERAKELKEKCMEKEGDPNDPNSSQRMVLKKQALEDENCKLLLSELDQSKTETILLDTELKSVAKLKQLDKMKSKEDLEKFLTENDMGDYIGRLEEITDNPKKLDEIKNLISQKFRSERMAIVDRLKEKFKKSSQIKVSPKKDEAILDENLNLKNEIANQSIADIETHKRRVESLFEYSNIASSFLGLKDQESNEIVGSNSTGRIIELEDGKDKENLSQYFSSSQGGEDASGLGGSSAGKQIDYLNALNQVLDFEQPSDANNKED